MDVVERQEIPQQDVFMAMVERAAALTATPEVDKVVLSRLIDITTRECVDSGALLERLIAQNPASFNFHVPLSDGGVLLGASPELLLQRGRSFQLLPLAGSARRQPDDVLDREAGNKLLASGKDRHEHELVTQAMKTVLTPRCRELSLPDSPQLVTTPTLWHLATPIEGTALAQENAMSLACLLHPTPALSGFPHQVAKRLIAELEPFDRQLFGGIVGWCDDEGNGEWVVTIRCARLHRTLRLFAGAGLFRPPLRWASGAKPASN
jgi:isochorismate synthase